MNKLVLLISLALVSAAYAEQRTENGWDQKTIDLYTSLGDKVDDNFDRSGARSNAYAAGKFMCPIRMVDRSARTSSVHELSPYDVKAIGSIGDSLTAANGAKAWTVIGVLTEDRGVSWSIGGEDTNINNLITLPNIFRQYSPNLHGFSTDSGKVDSKHSRFNVAHPGDTSFEMLEQAKSLVTRMKASTDIDFLNDWKVITFFIGGNDLCKSCKDSKYAAQYLNNVRDTLDYFHANLPRALVNMVLTLDVSGVEPLTGITCRTLQKQLCGCGLDTNYRSTLKTITRSMQQDVENLVNSGRYDTHDSFTVVVQKFMTEMTPPTKSDGKADYSYFAPDCFHFSSKGHAAAATELWKSMITPVGQKETRWTHLNQPIPCPSYPYIFTNKNSKTYLNSLRNKLQN